MKRTIGAAEKTKGKPSPSPAARFKAEAAGHAEFPQFVDQLQKAYSFPDRERLVEALNFALLAYDGEVYWSRETRSSWDDRLHLLRALHVLEHQDAHWPAIVDALASVGHQDPHDRLRELVGDLRIVAAAITALPPAPAKGRKAKPSTGPLMVLVHFLADLWETEKGSSFKQTLKSNSSAAFAQDVIRFIEAENPEQIQAAQLKSILEDVVKERRAKAGRSIKRGPSAARKADAPAQKANARTRKAAARVSGK